MKTEALDVHTGRSQMAVMSEEGEILIELQVATEPDELRRVVSGVAGPKRVIFEEGPLSGMIHDALKDVADQVLSCDPTQNASSRARTTRTTRSTRGGLRSSTAPGLPEKCILPQSPIVRSGAWCTTTTRSRWR